MVKNRTLILFLNIAVQIRDYYHDSSSTIMYNPVTNSFEMNIDKIPLYYMNN